MSSAKVTLFWLGVVGLITVGLIWVSQPNESLNNQSVAIRMATSLVVTPTVLRDTSNRSGVLGAPLAKTLVATAEPTCYAVLKDANLRSGPSTEHSKIGWTKPGDCLPLRGRNTDGSWVTFRNSAVFGAGVDVWIWKELIAGDVAGLPVVSSVPAAQPSEYEDLDALTANDAEEQLRYEQAMADKAAALAEPPTSNDSGCAGGCNSYPTWCATAIKGNVAFESGERIYHMPGQEYYDETKINPDYGERWFCTEQEAQDAGWRRAYN